MMKTYTDFMNTAVIASKSELEAISIDLDSIRQQAKTVIAELPTSTNDLRLKSRLDAIILKCNQNIDIIQKAL